MIFFILAPFFSPNIKLQTKVKFENINNYVNILFLFAKVIFNLSILNIVMNPFDMNSNYEEIKTDEFS